MTSILAILKPLFDYIDSGKLFRQPIQWLYYALGVVFAIFMLYSISLTSVMFKIGGIAIVVAVFIIILMIALSAFSVLYWFKRGNDVRIDTPMGARFVAIPVIANIVRCFGEYVGIVMAVSGVFIGVFAGIFWLFSKELQYIMDICPFILIVVGPVVGYLHLLINRYISERMLAIASIANDTHELATFNPANE